MNTPKVGTQGISRQASPLKVGRLYAGMQRCGGLEQSILLLCRNIDAAEVKQRLFLLRRVPEKDERDLADIEVFPARWSSGMCEPFRWIPVLAVRKLVARAWLTWHIVRSGIDLLHIHRGVDTSHCLTAAVCRICGIRVVRSVHLDPALVGKKGMLWVRRWLNRFPDAWVALAPEHADSLVRICGVPRNRIHVIPNGVDVEYFSTPTVPRQELRAKLEIDQKFALLSLARLDLRQKDYPTLLRALALARKEVPNLMLLIAGEGPGGAAIRGLVRDLNLDGQVRMLGHRSDVPDLMAAAEVLVFSTHWEGFGRSAAEAMAAGLPVVATDVDGLNYVCDGGRAGFLVRHEDECDLAHAIVRLATEPALSRALRERGRQRVRDHFSSVVMAKRYYHLYTALFVADSNEINSSRQPSKVNQ